MIHLLKLFRPKRFNIIAVLIKPNGKIEIYKAKNIVTSAGFTHYAKKICGETPTNTFNTFEFGTAHGTASTSSDRSFITAFVTGRVVTDTGYPKTNDTDPANKDPDTGISYAGTNVVTHRATLQETDAIAHPLLINCGIITNPSPGATEPILACWVFPTPFPKTQYDVLKIFENHPITTGV